MRIIAIGLGGAGNRIVDRLYSSDRRSSRVACVQALAVDVDEPTLTALQNIPEQYKVFFPALDLSVSARDNPDLPQTATIDINEIVSKVHGFESAENDAILVCCGLGGGMVDVVPHVITALRSTVTEPIFGLVTLPCLAEGERRSSKAADDIDVLKPLLDGLILFDNETWYKKIKAEKAHLRKKEKGFAEKLGLAKPEPELSPEQATYALLNDGIVRRISLILKAGEFKADGGIDLAEVVLDSGEVLNTMKGMGFITIGYAVERLPSDPFSFLSKLKASGGMNEEQKKKASRIIDLAKQAIYHEVSIPCDMTSAHKALVLIAGPSHELSMKGFMTVRKWIDRSIAGLETRSGDYPVMNTKNVAIIVMLSGLENIPRLTEIQDIREQFRSHHGGAGIPQIRTDKITLPPVAGGAREGRSSSARVSEYPSEDFRDEMIRVPSLKQASEIGISARKPASKTQAPIEYPPLETMPEEKAIDLPRVGVKPEVKTVHNYKKIITEEKIPVPPESIADTPTPHAKLPDRTVRSEPPPAKPVQQGSQAPPRIHIPPIQPISRQGIPTAKREQPHADTTVKFRETDRKKIERDLQRQRVLAISGHHPRPTPIKHPSAEDRPRVSETPIPPVTAEKEAPVAGNETPPKKVVLIAKKKSAVRPAEEKTGNQENEKDS